MKHRAGSRSIVERIVGAVRAADGWRAALESSMRNASSVAAHGGKPPLTTGGLTGSGWKPSLPSLSVPTLVEAMATDRREECVSSRISAVVPTPPTALAPHASVSRAMHEGQLRMGVRMHETDRSRPPLSGREVALVTLVARGLSNHEIASALHLSAHTIKHGVERLSQKLGVRNRVELAAWAGSNCHYQPADEDGPVRHGGANAMIGGAGVQAPSPFWANE